MTRLTGPVTAAIALLTVTMLPAATGAPQDGTHLDEPRALLGHAEDDASALEHEQRSLALAERLLADDGSHATRTPELVSRWQAATIDTETTDAAFAPDHRAPAEAVMALLERHEAAISEQQLAELDGFGELPAPVATSLAELVDAFVGLEMATEQAYAAVDVDALAQEAYLAAPDIDSAPISVAPDRAAESPPEDRLQEAGVDLAPVFSARTELLEASMELEHALATSSVAQSSAGPEVDLAPVIVVDLDSDEDNVYAQDTALLVDAGGNDAYHNNAGGTSMAADPCGFASRFPSAALVDVGAGADEYGDPDDPRRCGANGGARLGVGFLRDGGGDDSYHARDFGTNGGGDIAGVGFLLDEGDGQDTYDAEGFATNGGGRLGVGFLHDQGGADTYEAGVVGTNGGGYLGGVGFLADGGTGSDTYTAIHEGLVGLGSGGTNGGARLGVGFLLDAGGDDTYTAEELGTNGGAHLGSGFLLDASGNDTYSAQDQGTNGGALVGVGALRDRGVGDDTYTAEGCGANGAGAAADCGTLFFQSIGHGLGLLHDSGGTDRYEDPAVPNGGCWDCTLVPKGLVGAQVDT